MKGLREIPHEKHFVKSIVELYEDKECKNIKSGVIGIIIESETPDGGLMVRLFHTNRINYYKENQRVAWEWDSNVQFDESWYIDKNTGQPKKINGSLNFVGRQFDDI